jgi:phosphatidylglycerol lysyltransferase
MEQPSAHLCRVRDLVMAHGWNATAYQIINPGIAHWFSRNGDAVLGFVEFQRTRVVAGAPVCAEERLPQVRAEFERETKAAGQRVCYFGAESRLESHLRGSPDHSMVLLGAQPSFHPNDWPEMLASHASLRMQLNRARNKSVTVVEYATDRAGHDSTLRDCLREWLATRGLPPLHFLIEPQTLGRLFDRRVFVAEQRGVAVGFLVASPIPRRNGWLVEQFVRGRQAPNGTAELMIDAAVRGFAAQGSAYVTLGLSPLSQHVSMDLGKNPFWLRVLLAWMRAHGRRFYNFAGLDTFKTKFGPKQWEPVYAICNEPRFSPSMLYAIAGAFTDGKPIRTGLRALGGAVSQEFGWNR